MKYYYNEGGEIRGPFEKIELIGKNINARTLVWTEGMATWKPAGEVPMFADIIDGSLKSVGGTTPGSTTGYTSPRPTPSTPIPGAPRPNYAPTTGYSPRGQQPTGVREPQRTDYGRQNTYPGEPGYDSSYPGALRPQDDHTRYQPGYREPQEDHTRYQPGYREPQDDHTRYQPGYREPGYTQPQQPYGQDSRPVPSEPNYTQPQPPYEPPTRPVQEQSYTQPQSPYASRPVYPEPAANGQCPPNHFGWTITGTVLSALGLVSIFGGYFPSLIYVLPLILGIFGISKGNDVAAAWLRGNYTEAEAFSKTAKSMGMWSVFINIGMFVISLILIILVVIAGISLGGLMLGELANASLL